MMISNESYTSTFQPSSYSVWFPDGRAMAFSASTLAGETLSRGPKGVSERLQPQDANKVAYLVLPDGGKVEFQGTRQYRVDDPGDFQTPPSYKYWYMYKIQAIIDPYGLRTTFSYPSDGTLKITEPAGRWIQLFYFTYPGTSEVLIDYVRASDGRVVQYDYGRAAFAPGTQSWTHLKGVSYYNDPSIAQAVYTYKAPNVPDYAGAYNGTPLLATCNDPMYAGAMKKIDYRRVTGTTTPRRFTGDSTPRTTSFGYTRWGTTNPYLHTSSFVFLVTAPSQKVTHIDCDNNFRKTLVRQAPNVAGEDAWTYFTYDPAGNLETVKTPNRFVTTYGYDRRDRLTSIDDPIAGNRNSLGHTISYTYDAAGNKKSVRRANNQVVTYDDYDTMNHLLQQTVRQTPNPDAITKYGYDATGLLRTMQDPRLVALGSPENYFYSYDLMGRKTSLRYPADPAGTRRTEEWHYDVANRQDTFTNRAGKVQTLTYDALTRVTLSNWNDTVTPDVTTTYDAASRITSITNSNATITRAYYNDNLPKSETATYADNIDRTITYTYVADGGRKTLELNPAGGYKFSYDYTQRGQLESVTKSSTGATQASYDYDLNGNLTTRTLNNGTSSTLTFDVMDRVKSISDALVSGTRSLTYGYDEVGNRKWSKRGSGGGDAYNYDLSDQIIATKLDIASPDGSGAAGPQTIDYDANGNRTTFAPYGTTENYGINRLNQYTTRNGSQASYDANGNMTTGLDGSTYTYDAQNRLLSGTKAGVTERHTYDGLNRQVSREIGTDPASYNVYDGWDLIAEYSDGSSTPGNTYIYGSGGLIKNMITNRCYYQDGLGSTSALTDSSGNLLESYWYDVHGEPTFYNAGGTQVAASAYNIRHLFTGQQWYSELGLYDLRNRFYSPDIGRFLQADPIGFEGDPTNLYRYCSNSPMNNVDPLGEDGEVGRSGPNMNNIHLRFPVVFTGLNPAQQTAFTNAVVGCLNNRQIGNYFLTVSIGSPGLFETVNHVYPTTGGSRQSGNNIWWNPTDSIAPPHEVLHGSGVPHSGDDPTDIMAGPDVRPNADALPSEADIAAMLAAGGEVLKKTVLITSLPPGYAYHPLTGSISWGPPGLSDVATRFEGFSIVDGSSIVGGWMMGDILSMIGVGPPSFAMSLVMHP